MGWQEQNDRANQIDADVSRESKSITDVFYRVIQCGLVAVDGERNVLALNSEAERLIGVNAGSTSCLDDLPAELRGLMSEALLDGRTTHADQVTFQTATGEATMVSVSISPTQGAGEAGRGAIAVLHDLSVAHQLPQIMRRLDQLASIGTLTASMAHEIKNALVAIKTFVDMLLQQHQEAELAPVVSRELRRVDSLLSQILKFASPAKSAFAALGIHEVLDQSLMLVQLQLEGRKIRLTKTYEAAPATVRGDTYQLEQAFLNLFLNALEAMGPNGHLQVATDIVTADSLASAGSAAPAAPMLRVRIQDTGVGVPPENRERLFEPFFTTKPNGTGLGLSITRRIIQEHHGSIGFESELSQGTTFSILLPVATADR